MSLTHTFSEALQQVIDSFMGDLDDTLLHLYDRIKASESRSEKHQLVAMYNDLAAHINRTRNHNVYKLMK